MIFMDLAENLGRVPHIFLLYRLRFYGAYGLRFALYLRFLTGLIFRVGDG